MKRLFIEKTEQTPEINFSPEENSFIIMGISAPEDVRALYYPVIEWTRIFVDEVVNARNKRYSAENPFVIRIDLYYFNSSSAKFILDIFNELKRLRNIGIPIVVEWLYDDDDLDQKDAGVDFASLVEMEFIYIPKLMNSR